MEETRELSHITLNSGTKKPTTGLQDLTGAADRKAAAMNVNTEEYVINATNKPRLPVEPEEYVIENAKRVSDQKPVPEFIRSGISDEELAKRVDAEGRYISKYDVAEPSVTAADGRIKSPEDQALDLWDRHAERKKREMEEYFNRIDEENALNAAIGEEPTDPSTEPMEEPVKEEVSLEAVQVVDKDMEEFERELAEEMEDDNIPEVDFGPSKEKEESWAAAEEIADGLLSNIEGAYNEPLFKPAESTETVEKIKNIDIPTGSLPISEKRTGYINDADFADLLDDEEATAKELEEFGETEAMKRFRTQISEKIKPINNVIDISKLTISKKPVTASEALRHQSAIPVINWVLYGSKRSIKMKMFTGKDMERMTDALDNRVLSMANVRDAYTLIWEHDASPNKPNTLEAWMKVTPFTDDDHLFMAIYIATFSSSNCIPFTCRSGKKVDEKVCDNMWLTDNLPIMDMVKFKDGEVRKEFESILHSEANYSKDFYTSQIYQISEHYAIGTKLPSLFDVHMEPSSLNRDDRERLANYLGLIQYIDAFYLITDEGLREIAYKPYPSDMAKNLKSKVFTYGKIIDTLSEDQYSLMFAVITDLIKENNDVRYVLPASTCDHCGTTIEEEERSAKELLFTRHQLTALRTI